MISELSAVFQQHPLWSNEQLNVACFRRRDHFGDPKLTLDRAVRNLVEEQLALIEIQRIGFWEIQITGPADSPGLVWLYYAAKLDHLICVPALFFLFFGLRRLLKDAESRATWTVQP